MIRAYTYLAFAGVIWLVEAFLFSHYLELAAWQVILLVAADLGLFGIAACLFVRSLGNVAADHTADTWRLVSLLPMLAVVVGSFASLPILLLIILLGKAVSIF